MGKSLILSGRVQGVFCRHLCSEYAKKLGIRGSATNLADGTVRVILALDDEGLLYKYIDCLKNNPDSVVDSCRGTSMGTMTAEEKDKLEKHIRERLDVIRSDIASYRRLTQPVSPDNAIGRLTRLEALGSKSINEAALSTARHTLSRLEHALKMIDRADFGLCRVCEEPIPFQRLMVVPETDRCVECAERDAQPVVLFAVKRIKKQRGATLGTESAPDFLRGPVPFDIFRAVYGKGRSFHFRAGKKMTGPFPALDTVAGLALTEPALNFECDQAAKT